MRLVRSPLEIRAELHSLRALPRPSQSETPEAEAARDLWDLLDRLVKKIPNPVRCVCVSRACVRARHQLFFGAVSEGAETRFPVWVELKLWFVVALRK